MKKLILLLLALIFPLSAFSQSDSTFYPYVKYDLVQYNENIKTLQIPFYAENYEWKKLDINQFIKEESCFANWNWIESEEGNWPILPIQYIGKQLKQNFVFVTFDFSAIDLRKYQSITLYSSSIENCSGIDWNTEDGSYGQPIYTFNIPPQKSKILGCTNPSSPNYDPQATDDDWTCQDNRPRSQNITGFFETSKVNHGATTWTMTLNTSIENPFLDISKIQTWNKFIPVSFYNQDKKIIITIKQFDDKRLDVECTNYELTIPKNALTTSNWDKNDEAITGNFIVENCPQNPNPQNPTDPDDLNSQTGAISTIKDNGFYLSIFDIDENWKTYFNITNLVFLLGFVSVTMMIFYWFFNSIKKIFLWKKR